MVSQKEVETIRALAREGKSLNHIRETLNIPKSTAYYHFRKEVGQKQKENRLKIPEDSEVIGEICGVFAGDGNFYMGKNHHYRIRIALNHKEKYWKVLADFLEDELDKRPQINPQESYNRVYLRYSSVDLYDFLRGSLVWEKDNKTGTIRLKDAEDFCDSFKIGFLRGLIDTDGSKSRKRYIFNTISERLATNTSDFLDQLGIENYTRIDTDRRENCRDMYRTVVRSSLGNKFTSTISPRNPKKQFRRMEKH